MIFCFYFEGILLLYLNFLYSARLNIYAYFNSHVHRKQFYDYNNTACIMECAYEYFLSFCHQVKNGFLHSVKQIICFVFQMESQVVAEMIFHIVFYSRINYHDPDNNNFMDNFNMKLWFLTIFSGWKCRKLINKTIRLYFYCHWYNLTEFSKSVFLMFSVWFIHIPHFK